MYLLGADYEINLNERNRKNTESKKSKKIKNLYDNNKGKNFLSLFKKQKCF
jgi:hypothetical protein